jgi:hypothetical protein
MGIAARDWLRGLGLWVLLAPFLMLSLLSPGVMPARAADGTMTLVLCADGATSELVIDLATGQPVETAPAERCDWACGMCALGLAGSPAPLPPVILTQTRLDPPPARLVLRAAQATGLPPATGPPAAV